MSAPAKKLIAVVAGAGPGTGAAVATRFSKSYPVVLLARNTDRLATLVSSIEASGGSAVAIGTDISSSSSVKSAFEEVKKKFGDDVGVAAALYNVPSKFVMKPFLELSEAEFGGGFEVELKGAFNFSQSALPMLLSETAQSGAHSPTLIFTGATASVKGSAMFAAFAPTKFAVRALSQSLAREFGPKGVHVSHAVMDGGIYSEATKQWGNQEPDGKINPEAIAESYWHLHTQPKSAFTWEMDLRPAKEKW